MSKKYSLIKTESDDLKNAMDTLYGKLSVINNDLVSTLNDLQKNHHKKSNENKHNQSDDTLKAAQLLGDTFGVNELEEIMHSEKKNKAISYPTTNNIYNNPSKTILWHKEKESIVELFEKVIYERIRLEMMVNKLKTHQNIANNTDNDQFQKIKIKHQQHLNEYQQMLKKVRKHK